MRKIKVGQIGITHEHAAVKMASMRRLTDSFEIVGVVDDRHCRHHVSSVMICRFMPVSWLTEGALEVEGCKR